MDSRVGPRAAMRACTAFCAPLPSATIVITAPTPMMMPSIVRNERSLFARIACSATWKISPSSTATASSSSGVAAAWWSAAAACPASPARNVAHALLHVALRVQQRRAGQHEHGIVFGQAAHYLDVVEIGETGANLRDRKSTRLNSSHGYISYAVFCLKKKKMK